MGRVYTIEFENISVTNANGDADLFEIAPADDKPCKVLGLFFDQISDVGDAQEEMLRYRVIRGHTTSGNGTPVTPAPLNPSDAAAGFTAKFYSATIASVGSPVNLHSGSFNIRTGLGLILPPKMQWQVTQAQGLLVVRLMAGPADDLTMSGTMYVEELG
ncbi:MAG TPA: hypothetical protein VNL14_16740 [Candidatus Acidoferrales bacterium]|nr:hypothetical protein [Candidatus Acidoferrales bacterium]